LGTVKRSGCERIVTDCAQAADVTMSKAIVTSNRIIIGLADRRAVFAGVCLRNDSRAAEQSHDGKVDLCFMVSSRGWIHGFDCRSEKKDTCARINELLVE
jgi:hypothetical protein